MANLGREYPRLFRRDLGWREFGGRFSYLAKRIVCRGQGPQFDSWGWPEGDLLSQDGEWVESGAYVRWKWIQPPPNPPYRFIEARWYILTTQPFFRPYWYAQQFPTLSWYGDDAFPRVYPVAFPKVFPSFKKSATGAYDPLIAFDFQREALWEDLPP